MKVGGLCRWTQLPESFWCNCDFIVILRHMWLERHIAAAAEDEQRKGQCFWTHWALSGSACPQRSLLRTWVSQCGVCLVLMRVRGETSTSCSFTYRISSLQQCHRENGSWNQDRKMFWNIYWLKLCYYVNMFRCYLLHFRYECYCNAKEKAE